MAAAAAAAFSPAHNGADDDCADFNGRSRERECVFVGSPVLQPDRALMRDFQSKGRNSSGGA